MSVPAEKVPGSRQRPPKHKKSVSVVLLMAVALALVLWSRAAGSPAAETAPAPTVSPTEVPAVMLGSRALSPDTEELTVFCGSREYEALEEALSALPALRRLTITGEAISGEQYDRIRSAYPGLTLTCNLRLCGHTVSSAAETVSLAGEEVTEDVLSELRESIHRFPSLRKLDLTDGGLEEETVLALEQELDVHIVRSMTLYYTTFSSDAEEIDFSGNYIQDKGAALEALLPELPELKRVIMSDCGIRDKDMDELNRRHADIRFIWTVYFSIFSCRTDATNFICSRILNNHAELYSNQASVLRYCTDLVALDLGHKNITDLSFLYDLPHLKYLILVENDIPDITPIGSLQELTYLEIFWTKETDLTPLVNCKALTDLNISYTWPKADNAYETLMQMPQLERLWYCGNYLTEEQWADIRAVMPQCEMYLEFTGEPTGGTWREHPHYYEMRDAFDMYYMKGGTNGVDENGQQITVG